MIEFILIGPSAERLTELWQEEARLAQRLLHRQLPSGAKVLHLTDGHDALGSAIAAHTANEQAWALFLPHEEIVLAPSTLPTLMAAARRLGRAVCAYSNLSPPAGKMPDYLTLRGLERFSATLPDSVLPTTWQGEVCLAPLSDLRRGAGCLEAMAIGNAFYHDFSGYRHHRREEMLALLPSDCGSLLDVGGGAGGFLSAVKERWPACRTALVEMSATACELAKRWADKVWQGDFLALAMSERFSCITFLDVLEHIAQPQLMLEKARTLLAADGCIVASIPNIGHWSVIADLIEGRWDYAPAGIQCITHLRFFTRHGVATLFQEAGFQIEAWQAATLPPPPWFNLEAMRPALSCDDESLATVAWHCRARPR
ncbi:MAG: class I SAM-dependent methyltransferase [Rhodocyclaceae bacterium]|nr:class I SAM-dependent methyltransferase [Rhodocyclaceae bacterium]